MMSTIRRARPDEAEFLTELALRSKASWGYSAGFMRRCAPLLRVDHDYIVQRDVFIGELDGLRAGFYSLNPARYVIELDLLFVDPPSFGRGIGSLLLKHAAATAAAQQHRAMFVESDPGAEGFYLKFGAVRIGSVQSTAEQDRQLPLLRFDLPSSSETAFAW